MSGTLEESEIKYLASLFSALSDPGRLKILEYLREKGEANATELMVETYQTIGSFYNNIYRLKYANLIERTARGRYRLTPKGERVVKYIRFFL